MSKKKTYSIEIGNDKSIPESKTFQTALSLPKKTYKQIDLLKDLTHNQSRSNIIVFAVEHYLSYVISGNYSKDIQEKLKAITMENYE